MPVHDHWTAVLVGAEAHGIRTILTSADLTRLDFAVGSAGLIRAALSQALNHAHTRHAAPLLPRGAAERYLGGHLQHDGHRRARVQAREPKALEPYLDEIRTAAGADHRLDTAITALEHAATHPGTSTGRRLVSDLALALQASLLLRHAPPAVADAFCASRLAGDWAPTFGTLPANADLKGIIHYGHIPS